eukprot:3827980-Pyramimonas_sp.AAC.1
MLRQSFVGNVARTAPMPFSHQICNDTGVTYYNPGRSLPALLGTTQKNIAQFSNVDAKSGLGLRGRGCADASVTSGSPMSACT